MGEEGQNNFWIGEGELDLLSGFWIFHTTCNHFGEQRHGEDGEGSFGSTIDEFCLIFC